MDKKSLTILLLEKLKPYWELAEGFLLIVEASEDETMIDGLLQLLYQALYHTYAIREKDQLMHAQTY